MFTKVDDQTFIHSCEVTAIKEVHDPQNPDNDDYVVMIFMNCGIAIESSGTLSDVLMKLEEGIHNHTHPDEGGDG